METANTKVMQTIKASEPHNKGMKWNFTPLDMACLDMVIKGTWLFDSLPDTEAMQSSLAALLNHYPHIAGRIREESYIEANNDGVTFSEAFAPEITLNDIRRDKNAIDRYSVKLDLGEAKKGNAPLLTAKVTHLKDGCILSVHCAHVCTDGSGFYNMMRNWARIARGEAITPPVIDQSMSPLTDGSLSKEEVIDRVKGMGWYEVGPRILFYHLFQSITGVARSRSKAIHIPGDTIDDLRKYISDRSGREYGDHAVLAALVARMCFKLYNTGAESKFTVLSVVDFRGKLKEVPKEFVGNAVTNIPSAGFPVNADPAVVAEAVNDSLKTMFSKPDALRDYILMNQYAMQYKIPFVPFDLMGMNSGRPTTIYLNNFSGFPMFDLDFGAGKPIEILPHDLPDAVKIFPSPDGRSVDVYLMGYLAKYYNKIKDKEAWMSALLEDLRNVRHEQ